MKCLLSQIDYNQPLKNKKNQDVYYDVYTLMQVDDDFMPIARNFVKSWVGKESKLFNELPEMKKGNYYLVEFEYSFNGEGKVFGKVSKILPYDNQQDFINKYSNEKQEQLSSNQQQNQNSNIGIDDAILWNK